MTNYGDCPENIRTACKKKSRTSNDALLKEETQ
jgi:hypothetical protein